ALHQVVALAELGEEGRNLAEVVAVIGVAHDDVLAPGGRDAPHQRAPIPFFRDRHDARAEGRRDFLRSVGAAIVGDDHLARDAVLAEGVDRLGHAGCYGVRFIEAGHHHRELDDGRLDRGGESWPYLRGRCLHCHALRAVRGAVAGRLEWPSWHTARFAACGWRAV